MTTTAISPADLGLPTKFQTWRPGQWSSIETGLETDKRFIGLASPTGCHHPEQEVMLHNGIVKQAQHIKRGDTLMGLDSTPRGVHTLYNGEDQLWTVTPVKGDPFIINSCHVLTLVNTESDLLVDLTVREYLSKSKWFKHCHKLFRSGTRYQHQKKPTLDPYFLGLLLGDGSFRANPLITTADHEIVDYCSMMAEYFGLKLVHGDRFAYRFSGPNGNKDENTLGATLKELGMYGVRCENKFIPGEYFTATRKVRLKLLAGLLDTDGSLGHGYDFISKSKALSAGVVRLCRSLGLAAYLSECQKSCQTGAVGTYWRVSVSGEIGEIPCRIPRKKAVPRTQIKDALRTGFTIQPLSVGEYYGFGVDGDRRYLLGDFTVTHNSGKSVTCVSSAILEAKRAIYLTSSKGLQTQLHDDFSECGMIDMRGRQNYQCIKGNISCSEGRILECRDAGCPYNASRNEFIDANLASTNYAYYLSSVIHSEGVGDCGMLILDEAHAAVQELCNAIEIRLDHNRSNYIYNQLSSRPPHGGKISEWRTWAKFLLPKAQRFLKDLKQGGPNKQLSQVDQFVLTISRIASVSEDWILDESNEVETLISPLWPTAYASTYLFRDIPRIILASATLVPKTLSLLGIEEKDSVFLSQDHTFSPDRCPLYLFGACRVDYKMSPGQWQETMARIDNMIIGRRLDRKGIIHTTSYDYQSRILRDSEHSGIMIAPKSARETQAAIEEFRDSPSPRILVSPSITTGYDFPYDQCEYQILLKIPFIDSRSPVMKARSEADKEYLPYLVAQTLVQTCGRPMRAPDDRCENFLMDQHADWFLSKNPKKGYRHLVPSWFVRQIRYCDGPPQPPPPLSTGRS